MKEYPTIYSITNGSERFELKDKMLKAYAEEKQELWWPISNTYTIISIIDGELSEEVGPDIKLSDLEMLKFTMSSLDNYYTKEKVLSILGITEEHLSQLVPSYMKEKDNINMALDTYLFNVVMMLLEN
jgi:hypothetical protein